MNSLFAGVFFVSLTIIILLMTRYIFKLKGLDLKENDNVTQIIVTIISIFTVILFFRKDTSVIIYYFAFAYSGLFLELLADYFWFLVFGARLYRYYKNNILSMTSWYTLPYWGWGGIFFYMIYNFLKINIQEINFTDFIISFAGVMFLIGLILILSFAFYIYLTKKIKALTLNGFTVLKYIAFVFSFWIGLLYALYKENILYLIVFFIVATVLGTIAEGFLGIFIKYFYGERFWVYQKFTIIDKSTSLLIIPFWSAPTILSFFLMNLLRII